MAGKIKTIGFTYDLAEDHPLQAGEMGDLYREMDCMELVDNVAQQIESLGYRVIKIGNVEKVLQWFGRADRPEVDLVFNFAEGVSGRNRESQVPLLLEMLGIDFVGSDALSLGISLDKVIAKKCFIADGIPTPKYFVVDDSTRIDPAVLAKFNFPLIVKPCHEGSSKGITEKSRVNNEDELKNQIDYVVNNYHQPALVEEFISGQEFTVAVIGNSDATALYPAQVMTKDSGDLGDVFYDSACIMLDRFGLDFVCNPDLDPVLREKLKILAVSAFHAIDCRDWGRVDFRVDKDGNPFVLEINPLPSLSLEDAMVISSSYEGWSFPQMMDKILSAAFKRCGVAK